MKKTILAILFAVLSLPVFGQTITDYFPVKVETKSDKQPSCKFAY
jgi:hypothetical protein